ncbi:MAG: hypothetical protein PHS75_10795 [Anaerolineaceae bacterium]|nr:hypothetical protein [Anaerolineaceae bacterium]
MTSQEYIKQELTDFILQFPQTRVRYEYDELSDVHFIEIIPNSVYHLDEGYINWECNMYDKFVALYPDQNICFISDDALVGLENVQFQLFGVLFARYRSENINRIMVKESEINVEELKKSCFSINLTIETNTWPDDYSFNCSFPSAPDYSLAA